MVRLDWEGVKWRRGGEVMSRGEVIRCRGWRKVWARLGTMGGKTGEGRVWGIRGRGKNRKDGEKSKWRCE